MSTSEIYYNEVGSETAPTLISDGVYLKAVRLSRNIARVYLCDEDGNKLPTKTNPNGIVTEPIVCHLWDLSTKSIVKMFQGEWQIAFLVNYQMMSGPRVVLSFEGHYRHTITRFTDENK